MQGIGLKCSNWYHGDTGCLGVLGNIFFHFLLIIILRNSNSYPSLLGFQVHHRFADQLQNVENTSDVSVLSLQVAPAADAFADSADGQVSSPETLREYDFTIESRFRV